MESFVVLVQHQPFQFHSVLWNNGEKTSTRFRRRTSHSKISTNDEPYCKGAIERIILDFSKPGEEKLWKSKSLEVQLLRKRRDRGDPISASTERQLSTTIIMSKLWKVSPSASYSKWDDTMLGLLKSGKLTHRWVIERGNPLWPLGEKHTSPNQVSFMRRPARWNSAIHCERGNTSW